MSDYAQIAKYELGLSQLEFQERYNRALREAASQLGVVLPENVPLLHFAYTAGQGGAASSVTVYAKKDGLKASVDANAKVGQALLDLAAEIFERDNQDYAPRLAGGQEPQRDQ